MHTDSGWRARARAAVSSLVLGILALGCISPSDPLDHMTALEESQKLYTAAIRWGDLEMASRYVDPALRKDFLAWTDAFTAVRFTDYEIGEVQMEDDSKLSAKVEVTYKGYALPYYVERQIRERQVWYRDEALGDQRWHVRPDLQPLLAGLGIGE